MPSPSPKLFRAWAARHKELVELEDRLAAAQRGGGAEADALAEQVNRTRDEAQQLLARALESFRTELRSRGIAD